MDDVTPERWLPVAGWEGRYEISDCGRVKSLRRLRDGTLRIRILKEHPHPHGGHLQVTLVDHGRRATPYVHQLVMTAFVRPCPKGQEVRHWDGDPGNNRLPNLLYGTRAENAQDMVEHGRSLAGVRNPGSALTCEDVVAMRVAWQQGTRVIDLAARYGVSKATASRVVRGLAYREVPVLQRAPRACLQCGTTFEPWCSNKVYCTRRCKDAAT